MYPVIHILSLMSIISLTLGGLTGCGEKRVHVSIMSGAPGDERVALPQLDENSDTLASGLSNALVDESNLSPEGTDGKGGSEETGTSDRSNEPINLVHESSTDNSFVPLSEGHDFSAQSSSFPGDHTNRALTNIEDFQEPVTAQKSDTMTSPLSHDFSAELQDSFSEEDIEPVPETLQIAKIEPANSLQDQINRIKVEEFAKAANLEDVFFEFDSWALTREGQLSLNRDLGRIEQDPSSNLIIEGHADQRGTQAYNMVLAKRRAAAIQDYLKQAGVEPSRLAIISYGKDKPFCLDATEVCYQLNRRGHLLIQKP